MEEIVAHRCPVIYRKVGIFAHEEPVRRVVDRIERLDPRWVLGMHGGALTQDALPYYVTALREREFAYEGWVLGRELPTEVTALA